jgi:fatty-acyl-CoA synthase
MKAPYSRTLFELLGEQAGRRPDHLAAIVRSGAANYLALEQRARAVAAGLRRYGVVRGTRVALLISNRIEWLEACFGAWLLGAVVTPFSTWSKKHEIEFLLHDSGASILITLDQFGEQNFSDDLCELLPELDGSSSGAIESSRFPDLKHVFMLGREPAAGMLGYSELSRGPPIVENLAPGDGASAQDTALILYTSGSSNRPKAIRLQHAAIIENGFNIGERQGLVAEDRVFLPAPLFWSYGAINALPATLTHGATLVLQERFAAAEALTLIEDHCCTAIYTLPGMTSALIRHPDFNPTRTRSLRKGLTIGTPQDVIDAAQRLGASDICNIYGASETYGNCCVTPHHWPLKVRASTQGEPLPGVEIRIRSLDDATVLPRGAVGAVEVKGYTTPGYCGASEDQNAVAFTRDGFFKTGDLGSLNESGCFVFAGRHSEMIKRAGINVSPAEVEDLLLQHPDVAGAGVVGVPDAERGEMIVAFIVAETGRTAKVDEVEAHCRRLASRYKVPDRIVVRDMLPTTATGKLLRRELREMALTLVTTPHVGDQAQSIPVSISNRR